MLWNAFKAAVGLVGLLGLIGVGPAKAAYWSNADIATAVRVADAHWPGSPCRGIEQINWVAVGTVSAGEGGAAWPETCRIEIAWSFIIETDPTPDYLCTVVEHEFGHLAGYSHSADPRDVMFPVISLPSYDCAKAFPPKVNCRYMPRGRGVQVMARPAVRTACLRYRG